MAIGDVIYHQPTCINSMEWAKAELAAAPHGSLFLADIHQAPRGRQGRVWQSAPGQLLLTFVLKPSPIQIPTLFMAMSLGFLAPLARFGIKLKWPNDFVHDHKKVAGMLMELVWQGQTLQGVVLGVGFNVNNTFPLGHPLHGVATSLHEISGQKFELAVLQKEICLALESEYQQWLAGKHAVIFEQWSEAQAYVGSGIKIHTKDGLLLEGIMKRVLPDGSLQLHHASGMEHMISFENVVEVTQPS